MSVGKLRISSHLSEEPYGKKVEQKRLGGSHGSLSANGLVGRPHTDHLL
jgi:hypothetical protein